MGANQSGGIVNKPDLEATAETTSSATGTKVEEVIPVTAKIQELFRIKEFRFIPQSANPKRYERDELGMGYLFADNFKHLLRYVRDADQWYYYIDGIWKEDKGALLQGNAPRLSLNI